MRYLQQKVTQLEKANRSHVDNEVLQAQVSCFFVFFYHLLISLALLD